jgi:hypothetical protein
MKSILLFVLSFTLLSMFLTWLWLSGGNELYADAMQPIAWQLNKALGLQGPGSMKRGRFINLVPFVSLMLLTPRLTRRRRFGGLAIGVLILMLSHLGLNALGVAMRTPLFLPNTASVVSDAAPFILWFVIARDFIRDTLQRVRKPNRATGPAPGSSSQNAEKPAREENPRPVPPS